MRIDKITQSALLAGAVVAPSVVAAATSAPAVAPKEQRPNIILIMTDQQTASAMSCAGNTDLRTPAMDALAEDGVRLERAYCPFPLSGPCRASLMTGLMPTEIGATDNGVEPNEEAMSQSIGYLMRDAGYETMYAGKWHASEVNLPEEGRGFKKVCNMDDRTMVENIAGALKERNEEKPLFLVASFLDPHEICEFARRQTLPYGEVELPRTEECPNLPVNFQKSTYEPEAIGLRKAAHPRSHPTALYTEDDWREYLWAYYRLTERVDAHIGALVELLKAEGLYDTSLILFCSDHGDGAASHQWNQKWILQEECVNVPLIVKAPKSDRKALRGATNSVALSNIGLDIVKTICDYGGVELNEQKYRGKSLRGVLHQQEAPLHEEVFIETFLSEVNVRGWAIVEGKYKYVLYNHFQNREQLFDMESDRGEMVNLAVESKHKGTIARLREKMYQWGLHTGDKQLVRALGPLVKE